MGLTIFYSLRSTMRSATSARRVVGELRNRARQLPFQSIGPLLEFTKAACDYEKGESDRIRWLLIQANEHVCEGESRHHYVMPEHVIAFSTQPGDGCEPANFGLCRYPAQITVPDESRSGGTRRIKTNLPGWRWSSFCKTVYAGNPECGGPINFLKCHIVVVQLLDQARAIGLTTDVSDESGYWEARNAYELSRRVGGVTPKLAAFLAHLHGESDKTVLAKITQYAIFEPAA